MTSERSDTAPEGFDAVTAARAALDVLVFAPLGLGAKLVDDAPTAVKRARQELSNARFIGRMTVDQGVAQMRAASSTPNERPEPEVEPEPVEPDVVDDEVVVVVPTVDDLALPDYDHLPAIDIVAKLDGLNATELEAIAAYESVNRQRRTILGKLQQLGDPG